MIDSVSPTLSLSSDISQDIVLSSVDGQNIVQLDFDFSEIIGELLMVNSNLI